ncbi:MAG: glycosyltransferase family 4 protein [Tomitella sp.]|nr:glycosyltransferase family 4 protein [Tomitella sp.]
MAAVVTAISALIAFPLLRRAGVVDVPSHRSSHTQSTVRGGGVAIGCGITVATVMVMIWNITQHGVYGLGSIMLPLGFLILTWCYSAIGMSDDLDSLQPIGRLIGQVVLAVIFSSCIALFSTQGIAHVLVFAIIGVTLVNAVNFVDGLNGYVTTWSIITGAWFAFVGFWIDEADVTLISLALAGAAAGFLPFNLGRAKAFLGDTGSYGIGAAVFAIAVWLFVIGVPIVVIIAPMIFVLFDVGLTLVLRLFKGENIFLPHRQHIYQRIQQAGWSHGSVSLFHASLSVLACVLSVPTLIAGNTVTTYPAHAFWARLLALYAFLPLWLRKRNSSEVVHA